MSFRASREHLIRFDGLFPESHGHTLALTVLFAPNSLDIVPRVSSGVSSRNTPWEFRKHPAALRREGNAFRCCAQPRTGFIHRLLIKSNLGFEDLVLRICVEIGPVATVSIEWSGAAVRHTLSEESVIIEQRVSVIVLRKSISAQICLILYKSNNKGRVDRFVRESNFAKRL